MTYGEKAVEQIFNPCGDIKVQRIEMLYAQIIDMFNDERTSGQISMSGEHKRLYDIAITEAQTAQMWAVKALTWQD